MPTVNQTRYCAGNQSGKSCRSTWRDRILLRRVERQDKDPRVRPFFPPSARSPPSSTIEMAYTALFIPALAIVGQIHAITIPSSPLVNTSSLMDSSYTASSCDDIHHCRTIWSIVYSCITTIFACTYTSFHPDVPHGVYGSWDSFRLQICYFIIGILVPELVVAKAASQFMEDW